MSTRIWAPAAAANLLLLSGLVVSSAVAVVLACIGLVVTGFVFAVIADNVTTPVYEIDTIRT